MDNNKDTTRDLLLVPKPSIDQVCQILQAVFYGPHNNRIQPNELKDWLSRLLESGIIDDWKAAKYDKLISLIGNIPKESEDNNEYYKNASSLLEKLNKRATAAKIIQIIALRSGLRQIAATMKVSVSFLYLVMRLRRSITDPEMATTLAIMGGVEVDNVLVRSRRGRFRSSKQTKIELDHFLSRSDVQDILAGLRLLDRGEVAIVRQLVRNLKRGKKPN